MYSAFLSRYHNTLKVYAMRLFRPHWVIACLPIVLSACAHTPTPGVTVVQASQAEAILVGDRISLDQPIQGVSDVVIHSIYVAASGRTCRRLATRQGQLLAQRSCQNSKGDWYISRRLSSARALIEPVAKQTSAVIVESNSLELTQSQSDVQVVARQQTEVENTVTPERKDMVALSLTPGETLWAFADRVTGNPMNWQTIAADNAISDAREVSALQVLSVQASLLKPGL
ncbi:MAG: DVU3141 family protein [Granulosicoccus sp.]